MHSVKIIDNGIIYNSMKNHKFLLIEVHIEVYIEIIHRNGHKFLSLVYTKQYAVSQSTEVLVRIFFLSGTPGTCLCIESDYHHSGCHYSKGISRLWSSDLQDSWCRLYDARIL